MRVRVGHREFDVTSFPDGFGEKLDGETDFGALKIRVHDGLCASVYAATLTHEVLHVLWDEYCLKPDDTEERIVTAMANGICQFMRDNPKAMLVILQGLRK